MKKSDLYLGVAALVVFIVGVIYIIINFAPPAAPVASLTATSTSYTLAEVKTHNSAVSCWTTIRGEVYDVTTWINQHPGGAQAILNLCGTDGTAAFTAQHDSQRRPNNELATFIIGSLKK